MQENQQQQQKKDIGRPLGSTTKNRNYKPKGCKTYSFSLSIEEYDFIMSGGHKSNTEALRWHLDKWMKADKRARKTGIVNNQ